MDQTCLILPHHLDEMSTLTKKQNDCASSLLRISERPRSPSILPSCKFMVHSLKGNLNSHQLKNSKWKQPLQPTRRCLMRSPILIQQMHKSEIISLEGLLESNPPLRNMTFNLLIEHMSCEKEDMMMMKRMRGLDCSSASLTSSCSLHPGMKNLMSLLTPKSDAPCNLEIIMPEILQPPVCGSLPAATHHLSPSCCGNVSYPTPSLISTESCQGTTPSMVKQKNQSLLGTSRSWAAPLSP